MNLKNALDKLKATPEWGIMINTENIEDLLPKLNTAWPAFETFIRALLNKYEISYAVDMILEEAILLNRFPDYFLSETLSEKELLLFNSAETLCNLLTQSMPDFELLSKRALTFSILYTEWAKNDKSMQLEFICEIFHGYQQSLKDMDNYNLTNDEKKLYTDGTNKFLNKVLAIMKILDVDWKKTLRKYVVKNIEYDDATHTHMHKYLQAIFWENISLELNVKRNFKIINFLIQDYINIANKLIIDLTELHNYPEIKNTQGVIDLLQILITLNQRLDREYPYNTNIHSKNIIKTLQTLFSRLEFLIR